MRAARRTCTAAGAFGIKASELLLHAAATRGASGFASSGARVPRTGKGENEAYLDRQSGKIYWHSEFGDNDEELPDNIDDEKYISIPDKRGLDLGKPLVLDFAREGRSERWLPGVRCCPELLSRRRSGEPRTSVVRRVREPSFRQTRSTSVRWPFRWPYISCRRHSRCPPSGDRALELIIGRRIGSRSGRLVLLESVNRGGQR
jgi:hypothetical protein